MVTVNNHKVYLEASQVSARTWETHFKKGIRRAENLWRHPHIKMQET